MQTRIVSAVMTVCAASLGVFEAKRTISADNLVVDLEASSLLSSMNRATQRTTL